MNPIIRSSYFRHAYHPTRDSIKEHYDTKHASQVGDVLGQLRRDRTPQVQDLLLKSKFHYKVQTCN
jgi:hypothetical protein